MSATTTRPIAMLHLYQGNRLEGLADALAEVLHAPLADPFAPELVVVPHQGMGRWLALRLAERLGICANVRFPLPAGFVWELLATSLGGEVPAENGFQIPVLAWRVLGLLRSLEPDPRFDPLHAYLQDGDELKLAQLAQRIAQSFDRYLVYRPDWITAWERGQPAVAGDEWQAELWRRLATPEAGPHWIALQRRFIANLARGEYASQTKAQEAVAELLLPPPPLWGRAGVGGGKSEVFLITKESPFESPSTQSSPARGEGEGEGMGRLPERITVFGVPTLSPGYLEILERLAGRVELHLFLLNPCAAEWSQIVPPERKDRLELEAEGAELYLEVGNPLVASLGRQGQELFARIAEMDPGSHELFQPASEETMLGRLQNDLLELRDPAEGERLPLHADDHSIQFHACHSPMRETEVLYDRLLDIFDRHPELQPSDILVMTPDLETYGPVVEALFSDPGDRPPIPFSLADDGPQGESPLARAFFELLRLPGGRYPLDRLLALLEIAPVRRRFGIEVDDLPLITRWLMESGIRWGRDGAARAGLGLPAEEANSWRFGLRRMLLGYALPGEGRELFAGILPYDEIEGSAATLLGGVTEFVTALFDMERPFAGSRPPNEWAELLRRLLERFFLAEEEEADQLQALRDALGRLEKESSLARFDQPVGLRLVEHFLGESLREGGGRRFLGRGVTFCAFTPMRALPFQVICLIGMNDGAFPRDHRPPGFDLMAKSHRPGDRSLRMDDRYLFLETLGSARRVLYLSYVGQDQRENSPIPPSVVVSELLDYLGQCYLPPPGTTVAEALVVRHPLQPFSPDYFKPGGRLFGYSQGMCAAAGAVRRTEPAPFLPQPLPEPTEEWFDVEIGRLVDFLAHPTRFLLRERLGIQLPWAEELPESREPFAIDRFAGHDLDRRLLDSWLDGEEPELAAARERARGELPHGGWGRRMLEQRQAEVAKFAERLELLEATLPPQGFEFRHQGMRLHGVLTGLTPQGREDYGVRSLWMKEKIDLWVRHLALNLAPPPGMVEARSRRQSPEEVMGSAPIAPEEAGACLGELLEIYREGLTYPLPLFPKSAMAYAEAIAKGKPEEKALEGAMRLFFDGERPEGGDAWIRMAYPEGVGLGEEFAALAVRVFGSYHAALSP